MFHTAALGSNHTPTDCSRSEKRVPPVVRSEWEWTLRFGLKLSASQHPQDPLQVLLLELLLQIPNLGHPAKQSQGFCSLALGLLAALTPH